MSLISFIEKLQKKPRHIRVQIMWTGVILSSLVVFAFWIWSLSVSLAESLKTPATISNENSRKLDEMKQQVPSLWQSLEAGIGDVINTVKTDLNSSAPIPTVTPMGQQTDKLPIEQ